MMTVIEYCARNRVLANLLIAAILVGGTLSLLSLKRESMPDVRMDAVEVVINWPGADPEEVEEAIARKMEAAIDGLQGIRQYYTASYEGFASAQIEFSVGEDYDRVMDRIRNAIDGLQHLPEDVEPARYHDLKVDDNEVISLILWGDLSERQLKSWAEEVRAEVQRLPEISLVEVYDTRQYEIDIQVSKERLQQYGLTLADVSTAIESASHNISAGAIRAEAEEIRIRTLGRKKTGPEYANIVVAATPSGDVITLDRVATIQDGFAEDGSLATFNGQPCAMVNIEKSRDEDMIAVSNAAREYAAEKQKTLPAGLHVTPTFDEAEFVAGQLSQLSRNGLLGLVLLLLTLYLFLTTRLAFWVALGIPISLAGSLIVMYIADITLNQISLITFIVVLGIIVDDAIVVAEAIYHQRQKGKKPLEAAVEGIREVGMPITAAIMTTAIAFLPIGFIPGIMGMIMVLMPIVVIAALFTSLFDCLFILPAHLNDLHDPNKKKTSTSWLARLRNGLSNGLEYFADRIYEPAVQYAVRHRYVSMCIGFSITLITIGVIGGGHVRVVFWPSGDGDTMFAMVEFPDGTPPQVTADALKTLEESLRAIGERTETKTGEPLVGDIHTRVLGSAQHRGRINAQIITPSKREISQEELTVAWQNETPPIPGIIGIEFELTNIGMGGPPIEIWLQARNMTDLRHAADRLKDRLRKYDGVYQVADDFRPGKTELQVRLKPGAENLGITLDDVARQLRGSYYGHEAVQSQRGREEMKVRVRLPESERTALAGLDGLRIKTPDGHEVPFHSVADTKLAQGYSVIRGVNGLRRLSITAEVDSNTAAPHEILADLRQNHLDALVAGYAGMEWSVRGVAESNEETLGGLRRGFFLALLGIFAIMAVLFRSYLQPLVIVTVIPFGIIGAVAGHWLIGIPVTFLSMFGIIAMAGVVVNDGIVLVDCANSHLRRGEAYFEALCMAGRRRFRAIFLTSLSTCAGLTPIILERDLQAQVVIPMAVALAGGVAFSTVLNLVFVPCLLHILNDARRLAVYLRTREWPTPEQVEPACPAQLGDGEPDTQLGSPIAGPA